jgi:FkbM family methyltransferase
LEFLLHLKLAAYLEKNVRKPGTSEVIFDVGANQGSMTKLFLKLYKEIKIFAFEPLPIFRVNSSRVKSSQVALGSRPGSFKFYECEHKASSSLILPDISSSWIKSKSRILGVDPELLYKERSTEVTTIDNVVNENSIIRIFYLKIDTEGNELDVLKGASASLKKGVIRNIQIEIHHNSMRSNKSDEIEQLLIGYGYICKKTFKHFFGNFSEKIYSLK